MKPPSTIGAGSAAAIFLRLVAVVCLLGGLGGGAGAAELRGSTLSVGGKHVPLPRTGEATWRLLSEQRLEQRPSAPALDSVVAGAADDRTFRYLVVARTNPTPHAGGFGLAGDCRRVDLHSAKIVSRDGSTVAVCTFVGHVLTAAPTGGDPAWAAALRAAELSGRSLPPAWLVVGVRIADADDLLDVRYYFNPDSLGSTASAPAGDVLSPSDGLDAAKAKLVEILRAAEPSHDPSWLASDWSVVGVAGKPGRVAAVADLKAWAEGVHPIVYTGFKGRPIEDLPLPAAWAQGPPIATADVIADLPGEVALWKTVSWRTLGSSLDAIAGYVFTGNLGTAGGLTVAGGFVNTALYFLHEKAWETFGWKRSPGDLITALPPAGIER